MEGEDNMTTTSANGAPRRTILVVDDTPDNLTLLADLLKDDYKVKLANGGAKALKLAAAAPQPDLILLDLMMPDMDGHEVIRQLKADALTADIPVIFLTAKAEVEDEQKGLSLGAADYIHKPISPPIVLVRVSNQLAVSQARRVLSEQNTVLESLVQERTAEVVTMRDATIHAMASLAETRDNETGNHIRRTQNYVAALAHALKHHPRFSEVLTEQNIELLHKSAPLHDIGKTGVPDRILLKPGKLDPDEWEIMKMHTVYGRDVIQEVARYVGHSNGFLRFAREIAFSHQEKWDGSGYPEGLAGDEIPVSARLMAVADVYDALITRRVYKPAFSHQEAMGILRKGRGNHFDPDVLDAFVAIEAQVLAIASRFEDHE